MSLEPISELLAKAEKFQDELIDHHSKLALYRVGFSDEQSGMTGSAAGFNKEFTQTRASFEYIERMLIQKNREKILDGRPTSSQFRFALSNGIATHHDLKAACDNAAFELVERHCVLANWFALDHRRPQLIVDSLLLPIGILNQNFSFKSYALGTQSVIIKNEVVEIHTVAVVGKESHTSRLIAGFGAEKNPAAAIKKAYLECIQRIAFLAEAINEPLPLIELPTNSPEYHQEYFLHPQGQVELSNWLERGNIAQARKSQFDQPLNIQFVVYQSEPHLIQAKCDSVLPLIFGSDYQQFMTNLVEFNSNALFTHPVV